MKAVVPFLEEEIQFVTIKEHLARIEKARQLMFDNNIDAILLDVGTSMQYFLDLKWGASERLMAAVIPSRGDVHYVCPAFEEERLNHTITVPGKVRVWDEHESPYELVGDIMKDLGFSSPTIGMGEQVRFFITSGIRNSITRSTIVDGTPVVAGCRSIKSLTELALMKRANEITLEAFRVGLSKLEEGMTQFDLDEIIYQAMIKMGASERGWVGSSFGKYSAFPHGSSKPSRLLEGDVVLIDGGCKVGGYQADITRTTVFGKPSEKFERAWDTVKEAQTAVFTKAKAGVPCEELDNAARAVIEKRGFGAGYENFFHRVGHGIGMDFHEWEYLVKGNKEPMQIGMCFSNEPGIYLYGEFGVRLEDCWYVTEHGYESFTKPSPSIDNPIG